MEYEKNIQLDTQQILDALLTETEQFAPALEEATRWMKQMDAERMLRQFSWFRQKISDGMAACERGEKASLQALADAAVEAWRFEQVGIKVVKRMDLLGIETFMNRYSWFLKKTDAIFDCADVRIVDLTGEIYSVGMAVSALNADEFDDEELVVYRMVDPVIMAGGKVLRTGTVMLGSANE